MTTTSVISMAPTNSVRSGEEETTTASSAAACSCSATTPPPLTAEDLDSEPFYGMFDRHSDDDEESAWTEIRLPIAVSPRGSIPEASETFQRAMRQLDGIEDAAGRKSVPEKVSGGGGSEKRKCCQAVKKAASFSAPDSHSSSSASSKDDVEARRRKSMPCMSRGKHVQWADEAGVADLVSVRLIRPRLQAQGEKEEAQVTSPRSILRRLTGIH
ncbi:hypothetical protein ACOMHN_011650 [Nucella lapillus]